MSERMRGSVLDTVTPVGRPSDDSDEGNLSERALAIVLLLPVLLVFAGRFVSGPHAWGWNHFAYLELPLFAAWTVLAFVLLNPWAQQKGSTLVDHLGERLFESPIGPFAMALFAGAWFLLLPEAVFFMGDGYLVSELIEKGLPFRAFDNMDYRSHFLIFRELRNPADPTAVPSAQIYQVSSAIAGALGAFGVTWMAGRLTWERWQKLLLVVLFLATGSVALFFGYVESYSFLYPALAMFTIASILVLEEKLPLWVASIAFGFGWFFHLTAIFSGVGLLFLAAYAPIPSVPRRWGQAFLPALGVFALSVMAHVAGGFDQLWVEKEFFQNSNAKQLWIGLGGENGLFTYYHWKDLFNLVLLVFPIPTLIVLARLGVVRRHFSDRRVQFLLLQMFVAGALSIALDRKLGGARDWDLLVSHSFPALVLATFVLRPKAAAGTVAKSRRTLSDLAAKRGALLAMTASWLVTAPWILLQHDAKASVDRFSSIVADFPRFERAYSYEELGKYFRKQKDFASAEAMYERCVETYPANARFHVLLGAIYMARYHNTEDQAEKAAALTQAIASYRDGVAGGSEHHVALSSLGKALYLVGNLPEAVEYMEKAARVDPRDVDTWVQLGMAQLQLNQMDKGAKALTAALNLEPQLRVRQALGGALLTLGRHEEAEVNFRTAIANGEKNRSTEYGLAAALIAQIDIELRRDGTVVTQDVAEAEQLLQNVIEQDPSHTPSRRMLDQLRDLQRQVAARG